MPEKYTSEEREEMRLAVEESDAKVIRVPRSILLRLLAPEEAINLKPAGNSIPFRPARAKSANKFVAEFEKNHPDWIVKEVDCDASIYTSEVKARLARHNIRHARIRVSIGTARYYTPNTTMMTELMKELGHK